MLQIVNFENSENRQFGKLQKFPTQKIPKIVNLENLENYQFKKV